METELTKLSQYFFKKKSLYFSKYVPTLPGNYCKLRHFWNLPSCWCPSIPCFFGQSIKNILQVHNIYFGGSAFATPLWPLKAKNPLLLNNDYCVASQYNCDNYLLLSSVPQLRTKEGSKQLILCPLKLLINTVFWKSSKISHHFPNTVWIPQMAPMYRVEQK